MVYHTDLRLGEVVYVLVFYTVLFSWLLSLNGFKFIFLWRDSENNLLAFQFLSYTGHGYKQYTSNFFLESTQQNKNVVGHLTLL